MKLKSLIFSALLATAVFAVRAQTIEDAVAKFSEGQKFLSTKEFAKAIPVLEEALKMAQDVQDNDGAIALADDIKKVIPQVYMFDGVTLLQAKKYQEAIQQLLKAEELASQYGNADVRRQASRFASTAYMAMGADFFNNKDYVKALEIFTKGYDQDPKNIQLALYTAKSYAETKDLNNAAKLYNEVIAVGAENSKYEAQAKEAKADLDNYLLVAVDEAAKAANIAKVEEVAKMAPQNDKVQLLFMQAAFQQKAYNAIIEFGEQAAQAQISPETKSAVYLIIGGAYQAKGNNAKAIENLKKVSAGQGVAQAQQIIKDLSAAQ